MSCAANAPISLSLNAFASQWPVDFPFRDLTIPIINRLSPQFSPTRFIRRQQVRWLSQAWAGRRINAIRYLTAYSSQQALGEAGSAARADYEALREFLTNTTIGWTNEDLEVRQITCRDGRSMDTVVTELLTAFQNYVSYDGSIVYNLGGEDRTLGMNSGNCASWVNTIVDIVGLNLPNRFGDFSSVDWGEDHVINLSAFA